VVDSDGEQDVATTMSLLEGFLLLVHKRFPHIKKIVLISDNSCSLCTRRAGRRPWGGGSARTWKRS